MQIGIIGSYWSDKAGENALLYSEKVGEMLAERGIDIICGGDDKKGGIIYAAGNGAKKKGGNVIGILVGVDKSKKMDSVTIPVLTGMTFGGREYILAISSDAVIAIRGGAGTLNEITVAYQNYVPVVVLGGTGGWADMIADTYLDGRKRELIFRAATPKEAVNLAIKLARERIDNVSAGRLVNNKMKRREIK